MRSLRGRLAWALVGTAVASVAVTAIVSVGLVRGYAERTAHEELGRLAQALAAEPGALGERFGLRPVRMVLRVAGDRFAVVFADGTAQGDAADIAAAIDLRPVLEGRDMRGTASTGAGDFAYVAAPVAAPRARGVLLARPVGLTRDLFGPIAGRVLLAAAAAVVAAAALSALLARRLVRPLRQVASAAERVATGDLAQRVPVDADDEVGELAASFNAMSEALAEAQRREREFLASVSHELRTPLTAIRGYAEALSDNAVRDRAGRSEALAVIRAEAARLERLVQDVMDLARLGARTFRLHRRAADLAPILREAAAAHRAQADEAGLRLEVDVPDRLPIETDPDRVRQVVSNLVENAVRVTGAGGAVRLSARAASEAVVVEVSDTGPGIAAADLPHVFERSYLWGASRGLRAVGTGLGLAIVRELVQALGGAVEAASRVGEGITFRVRLPAREAQPQNA